MCIGFENDLLVAMDELELPRVAQELASARACLSCATFFNAVGVSIHARCSVGPRMTLMSANEGARLFAWIGEISGQIVDL